jgi:hypothetical protein
MEKQKVPDKRSGTFCFFGKFQADEINLGGSGYALKHLM